MAWTAANNGTGKRKWFVVNTNETLPVSLRYRWGKSDRLIKYATCAAAQRASDKLNREAELAGEE